MPNKLVNVGLHAESLMFKSPPDPTKPLLDDQIRNKALLTQARKHSITEVGIELSFGEQRALFAVQRLLDNTSFKGNARPSKMPVGNPYLMKGNLPVLDVKIADYLEAYGVSKKKTTRKKNEYSAGGRKAAIAALHSLANKKHLLAYDRVVFDPHKAKKINKQERIEVIDSLVQVKQANGRLQIIPSPILFDQVDTYYMVLPSDLYTKVVEDKQKSLFLFIHFLLHQHEMNRRRGTFSKYLITRHLSVIGYAIGLGHLVVSRQWKKLRARINQLYQYAMDLGYLRKFEADMPGARYEEVDRMHLKPKVIMRLREVQRKAETDEV